MTEFTQDAEEEPPMSIADQELRLQCLHLAESNASNGTDASVIVANAQAFHTFATGASAKSPREIIAAALDAANVR